MHSNRSSGATGGNKRKHQVNHHRTLDIEHNDVMRRIDLKRSEAREALERLAGVRHRINDLERVGRKHLCSTQIDELMCLYDSKSDLETRTKKLLDEANHIDYLVTTGDILFRYYDVVENGDTSSGGIGNTPSPSPGQASVTSQNRPSILNYFNVVCAPDKDNKYNKEERGEKDENEDNEGKVTNTRDERVVDLRNFMDDTDARAPGTFKVSKVMVGTRYIPSTTANVPGPIPVAGGGGQMEDGGGDDRATLLDKYLACIDKSHLRTTDALHKNNVETQQDDQCPHCGKRNMVVLLHDGCSYCTDCFTQEYILIDHDKPSYKDPPKEIIYYAYKRINHFNEWLNQIQGKETTEIPEEVYDRILLEIKKEKITNMATLTRNKVRNILKKLRINKYYEHLPHIINRLNGLPVPHMSQELEERLRQMFCQIQVPFLRHAPAERKNFLSYSYVLHKFMQLLEKDEYLDSFPLLKSREKLHQQDVIWQKICEDLRWAFYKSI